MRRSLAPGVTENELWTTFMSSALEGGAEYCETRLLSSGPRTNPWFREASTRALRAGDLLAIDTDLIGNRGYITDISRTYLCGDKRPTDEQRRLHGVAFEFIQECIPEFRVGVSFEDLGQRLGTRLPSEFHSQRYPMIAHGSPMGEGYPCVKYEEHHEGELEAGMVFSIEAYVGAVGGREGVKLEVQIIVGDDEAELLSSAPFDERLLS
jgi:Xaa-Pro aminopeptidase